MYIVCIQPYTAFGLWQKIIYIASQTCLPLRQSLCLFKPVCWTVASKPNGCIGPCCELQWPCRVFLHFQASRLTRCRILCMLVAAENAACWMLPLSLCIKHLGIYTNNLYFVYSHFWCVGRGSCASKVGLELGVWHNKSPNIITESVAV